MIKLSYNFILPHLIALINLIISTAVFPQIWKQSKIIPIYKGSGNKQDFNNFRPIALLSVISKIFERHLFNTIYEYLIRNKLLSDYQFGFKPKHSTTDALLAIQKAIIDARNRIEYVCVVVLDLRKAFDIIRHIILIFKLTKYGFSRITIKLIESYLGNRKQAIYHN